MQVGQTDVIQHTLAMFDVPPGGVSLARTGVRSSLGLAPLGIRRASAARDTRPVRDTKDLFADLRLSFQISLGTIWPHKEVSPIS